MKNTVIIKSEEKIETINCIDTETGEVTTTQVKVPHESKSVDYGWAKLFLNNFLDTALSICSPKERVMYYFILNMDANNKINTTQKDISKQLEISVQTVNLAIAKLKHTDFLKYKNGVYMISPNIIFNGSHEKRMKALQQYYTFTD